MVFAVTKSSLPHIILLGKAITSFSIINGGVIMSNCCCEKQFIDHLCDLVGETVTIFCTCGGDSGAGFTGVVLGVYDCYVKLVVDFGSAPGCALGNACCGSNFRNRRNGCGYRVGSVVNIPLDQIVALVRNAV